MRALGMRVAAVAAAACVLASCTATTSGPTGASGPAIPGVPAVVAGWNSWNSYACDISAARIEKAADALVTSGMKAAGYVYVVVDDCWAAPARDASGALVAEPSRFPDGMAAVAAYVHGLGLKFGLYTSATDRTCAQRYGSWPGSSGSEGHEATDAATFASWGVDYVKDDWCAGEMAPGRQRAIFQAFAAGIVATGRPMVLSINPNSGVRTGVPGASEDWSGVASTVRITNDVVPAWRVGRGPLYSQGVAEAVAAAEDAVASGRSGTARADADMLVVGDPALTDAEARTQLGILAVLGLPLMAGNDPAAPTASGSALLTNPALVALDQDATARPTRSADRGGVHVWTRATASGRVTALFNPTDAAVTVPTDDLAGAASLWTGAQVGATVTLAPHDTLLLRSATIG